MVEVAMLQRRGSCQVREESPNELVRILEPWWKTLDRLARLPVTTLCLMRQGRHEFTEIRELSGSRRISRSDPSLRNLNQTLSNLIQIHGNRYSSSALSNLTIDHASPNIFFTLPLCVSTPIRDFGYHNFRSQRKWKTSTEEVRTQAQLQR